MRDCVGRQSLKVETRCLQSRGAGSRIKVHRGHVYIPLNATISGPARCNSLLPLSFPSLAQSNTLQRSIRVQEGAKKRPAGATIPSRWEDQGSVRCGPSGGGPSRSLPGPRGQRAGSARRAPQGCSPPVAQTAVTGPRTERYAGGASWVRQAGTALEDGQRVRGC